MEKNPEMNENNYIQEVVIKSIRRGWKQDFGVFLKKHMRPALEAIG